MVFVPCRVASVLILFFFNHIFCVIDGIPGPETSISYLIELILDDVPNSSAKVFPSGVGIGVGVGVGLGVSAAVLVVVTGAGDAPPKFVRAELPFMLKKTKRATAITARPKPTEVLILLFRLR